MSALVRSATVAGLTALVGLAWGGSDAQAQEFGLGYTNFGGHKKPSVSLAIGVGSPYRAWGIPAPYTYPAPVAVPVPVYRPYPYRPYPYRPYPYHWGGHHGGWHGGPPWNGGGGGGHHHDGCDGHHHGGCDDHWRDRYRR